MYVSLNSTVLSVPRDRRFVAFKEDCWKVCSPVRLGRKLVLGPRFLLPRRLQTDISISISAANLRSIVISSTIRVFLGESIASAHRWDLESGYYDYLVGR